MNPPGSLSSAVGTGTGTPIETVVIDLLLAFVLGAVVAWLYGRTHRGLSYSRNMVHSLVLLCMIVSMVMLVVGDSVARAFGLVGALAIIRFRTVVRDARDTTFIFLALSIGIAIGAHQYGIALAGALIIGAVAVLLQVSNFATRHADTGLLRVRGDQQVAARLTPVLQQFCRTHEPLVARDNGNTGESEFSYRIRMYAAGDQAAFLNAVRDINGASQVTVALDEGAEEW